MIESPAPALILKQVSFLATFQLALSSIRILWFPMQRSNSKLPMEFLTPLVSRALSVFVSLRPYCSNIRRFDTSPFGTE